MCGSKHRLHVHHMRYTQLGTKREWKEVAVICERCHTAYHKRVPRMPEWPAERLELLSQLAATLMREGIDVSTFHNHGEELNRHWLAKPIVEEGLWEHSSAGKNKRKVRRKLGYSDDNKARNAKNYWRTFSR